MDSRFIHLQLFAEGDETGTPAASDKTKPGDQVASRTFTQEDVNAIAARESKSAVEKLLKEAGIAGDGDYKAAMQAFKKWQDSQKSELEKATGAKTALEKERDEAVAKATAAEKQLAAIGKGIPADKAAKYIKLAEAYIADRVDFTAALDLALKDFPVAAAGVGGQGGNPPPAGKPQTSTFTDAIKDRLRSKG